jgi:magnesium-transporting ATPase (P-type)
MNAATISTTGNEATAWHAVVAADVVRRLNTNTENGLDAAEVSRRLTRYGPNRLPEGKKQGPLMRFLVQFNNTLVYVLLVAGFVKLMIGLWVDAAIILAVVLINALLGFIQEGRAEKALDSIRNMLSAVARAIRGGETRMIPAQELVPGDVVLLESGDKVPADLRLKESHDGGIRVTMITGDHRITAAAIAKMLGIGDGKTAVTGAEIQEMDTATLQERCREVDVFARASPEHKLRLVKAMQASQQIVAMTGDGVNDAPALKKADIGVAMGIKGTEVTKEVAAMVLTDDNFASITAAVREGRILRPRINSTKDRVWYTLRLINPVL